MYKTAYDIMAVVYILLQTGGLILLSRHFVHMLQQESYYKKQYLKHLTNCKKELLAPALVAVILIVKELFLHKSADHDSLYELVLTALLSALTVGATALAAHFINSKPAIKPLVYTARIKRLYVTLVILLLAAGVECALLKAELLFSIAAPIISLFVLLAAVINSPIEYFIKQLYILDAKNIMAQNPNLKIVGITGSYGKTSTKFILSTLLQEKYSVLTPPSSYNTTMGVVRAIREYLQPDDEVFICEMGARHRGDIAEICKFVKPDVAIITSVGPQHLETFKTIETVRDTKYELVEAVKEGGVAFFPQNNEYTRQMYEKTEIEKHYFDIGEADIYMYAKDIEVSNTGSSFVLVNELGESVSCTTVLLGEHNIRNITACAACAFRMGLSMEEIRRGIEKIKPIEHRMQIVTTSPYTIIDDAFNSNPKGAEEALKVLSKMPQRRIIVTPGFVELGIKQDESHFELGRQIAQYTDAAILVGGERTDMIQKGIVSQGYVMENVYTVQSLQEALEVVQRIATPGSTVLFENDLPDVYMSK